MRTESKACGCGNVAPEREEPDGACALPRKGEAQMKSILKKDRILVFVALLGLLASLVPLAARTKAEQSNRYYDYILDYSSLRYMASQSTRSEGEWLELFASLGIRKVTVAEATALGLDASAGIPIHSMTVKDAMGDFGWESSYPDEVIGWMRESKDVSDAIICTDTAEAFDWVMNAFNARVENFTAKTCRDGEKGFIFLSQQPDGLKGEKLLNLRLGIWPDIASLLEEHGYQIVPRTETMKGMNGTRFAQAYIEVLEQYASPYFMNSGDELIGYESDEGRELLAQYLRESGASLAMVEQNDQSQNITWPGTVELLNSIDYHGIRVFNEWGYIQNRYAYCGYTGPEEITNSFFRAIVERNCKVIWLKMILEPDNDVSWDADQTEWTYITDPTAYEKMILDLDARLEPMGYTRTTVPPMELETPSAALHIVQGIGTAALLVLLFDLFFLVSRRTSLLLLALAALGMTGLAVLKPASYPLLLSMAGGIVMPSIAAVGLCRVMREKRRQTPRPGLGRLLGDAAITALTAIATALCGSLLASAALSQLSYILEIDLYRGVKLMQLIPIGLFALAYLLVFAYEETGARDAVLAHVGPRGEKGRIKRFNAYFAELMKTPMQLGWFLAVVVIAVAAVFLLAVFVYYIYRTGNSATTSSAELAFRNFLENTLVIRPRTKEMIVGWPMLLLFVWSLRRGMKFLPMVFGLGMTIGLVSVVNTFLHIRTPFLISLLRTGWGVLFGLLIGLALVLLTELIYRAVRHFCGVEKHV